jgi:hypothetical protein
MGTDPNRVDVFTEFLVTNFIAALRAACTIPQCFGPGGSTLPDRAIFAPTGGYASIPLAGVQATAPYLHNGSVPTVYHLLAGDRPATFYRANTTYDQKRVETGGEFQEMVGREPGEVDERTHLPTTDGVEYFPRGRGLPYRRPDLP